MQGEHYAFIYDDVLQDRRAERQLAEIETRLTSLDIQGRVGRLTLFRTAKDLVENMVHHGATTIVIIGNDFSLDKMLWFLPDLNITLGYLPLSIGPTSFAERLGIPLGMESCDILAARFVEVLDMGRLNERYFLNEVRLEKTVATLEINGKYHVSALNGGSIVIANREMQDPPIGSPLSEEQLSVRITPIRQGSRMHWGRSESEVTHLMFDRGQIVSPEPVDVRVDYHTLNGFRFYVSSVPKKLKMITGRSRRITLSGGVHVTQKRAAFDATRGKLTRKQ